MTTDNRDAGVVEPGGTRIETGAEEGGPGDRRRFGRGDGTTVEQHGPGATSVEPAGGPATSFEGAAAGEAAATRVNVPHDLRERFQPLADVRTRGAEADLLLVADRQAGGDVRVLKLYRHAGERVDRRMLDLVRRAEEAHVVKVYESDLTNGTWWELLEYCELGSLADLIDSEGPRLDEQLVHSVVDEIASALEHIHALPCVHRDIKPANILVRTREPFDLVLADFGLATVIGHTKEMRSASRTVEYSAPEAAWGVVGPPRDWWSLGILLVEVITGKHPFTNDDRTPYEQRQIDAWLATRSIDVSGVKDDRLRLLCRGLLVRDPEKRWGAEQVRQWRKGESPHVAAEEQTASRNRVRAFPFWDAEQQKTVQFRDPRALAAALAHDPDTWQRALGIVGGSGTGSDNRKMRIEFRRFAESVGNEALTKILDDKEDSAPEAKLVRILVALDPGIPPTFRGLAVDPEGLARLARSDDDHYETIHALNELGVLRIYSDAGDEDADLAECESEWDAIFAYTERALRGRTNSLPAGMDVEELVRIALGRALGAAADEEFAAAMTEQAERAAANPLAMSQSWFARAVSARGKAESQIGHDILVTLLEVPANAAGERAEAARLDKERKEREQRRARFARTLREELLFVLIVAALVFLAAILPAVFLSEHVKGSTAGTGEFVAGTLDVLPLAGLIATALWLAGAAYNVWVFKRDESGLDYWDSGAPGWLWLGVAAAPAGVIALLALTGGGYVPPVAWLFAGIAGAVAAVWLMLLRVALKETRVDTRIWAGVLVAIPLVAVLFATGAYDSSRAATRTEYAAESKFLGKHVPLAGCKAIAYAKSPQRDYIGGGAKCAGGGFKGWFVRIPSDASLSSYAAARQKGVKPVHKRRGGGCESGAYESRKWTRGSGGHGPVVGRLLCYHRHKTMVMEWSNEATDVYATVGRADGNSHALYSWWLAHRLEGRLGKSG
jgi:serine/threonine protein kinase